MARETKDEKPWSTMDIVDLRTALEQGDKIEQVAAVHCRSLSEVKRKADELGLAYQPRQG